MDWHGLESGRIFGYTKEQNREELLKDIEKSLNSNEDNNMKIINRELEQYGGKEISFKNGCKDAILLCAVNCWTDYYYIYYDVAQHKIRENTGCDGIAGLCENKQAVINKSFVNDALDTHLAKVYYTEVPFTKLYKIS